VVLVWFFCAFWWLCYAMLCHIWLLYIYIFGVLESDKKSALEFGLIVE
jgi:hypothetical protein